MAYDANGIWKAEDDSAASRVNAITSADSPLMQQARGMGVKAAARRGLVNSTMAGRSAESAVISAATPLATTDATIAGQKNLSAQGAGEASRLADQNNRAVRELQELTGTQALSLADRNAAADRDLQTLRGTQATDLQKLTGDQQSGLATQQAASQRDLQVLTGEQQSKLADKNITGDYNRQILVGQQAMDQQAREIQSTGGTQAASIASSMIQSYNAAVAAVMANENIPADARGAYLTSLQNSTRASLNLIAQTTGFNLEWGAAA